LYSDGDATNGGTVALIGPAKNRASTENRRSKVDFFHDTSKYPAQSQQFTVATTAVYTVWWIVNSGFGLCDQSLLHVGHN